MHMLLDVHVDLYIHGSMPYTFKVHRTTLYTRHSLSYVQSLPSQKHVI